MIANATSFQSDSTKRLNAVREAYDGLREQLATAEADYRGIAVDALMDPDGVAAQKAVDLAARMQDLRDRLPLAKLALEEAEKAEDRRLNEKSESELRSERAALAQHLKAYSRAADKIAQLIADMQSEFSTAAYALDRASTMTDVRTRQEIGEMMSLDNLRSWILVEQQRLGLNAQSTALVPEQIASRRAEVSDYRTGQCKTMVEIIAQEAESVKVTYARNQIGGSVAPRIAKAAAAPTAPSPAQRAAEGVAAVDPLMRPSEDPDVINLRGSAYAASLELPAEPTVVERDPAPVVEPYAPPLPWTAEREAEMLANASI